MKRLLLAALIAIAPCNSSLGEEPEFKPISEEEGEILVYVNELNSDSCIKNRYTKSNNNRTYLEALTIKCNEYVFRILYIDSGPERILNSEYISPSGLTAFWPELKNKELSYGSTNNVSSPLGPMKYTFFSKNNRDCFIWHRFWGQAGEGSAYGYSSKSAQGYFCNPFGKKLTEAKVKNVMLRIGLRGKREPDKKYKKEYLSLNSPANNSPNTSPPKPTDPGKEYILCRDPELDTDTVWFKRRSCIKND